jgi:hypothetical protein
MLWQLLSMCIPGAVLQPVVNAETDVRIFMPHTYTLLHTSHESNGMQEPKFEYQHEKLDINYTCLSWGLVVP